MNSSFDEDGWSGVRGARLPTASVAVFLAGLCLVSSGANLLLVAGLSHQLRRGVLSPAHALLLSLGCADLGLSLACLTTRFAPEGRSFFLCPTSGWLLQICLVAKSLTWAAVGQARSGGASAGSPSGPPGWGWKRLAGLLGGVWVAALLLPLPDLFFARLEAGPAPDGGPRCRFRSPDGASEVLDALSKLYPLLACGAPAIFAAAAHWRALRCRRRKNPGAGTPDSLLASLTLLFHATWMPEWVAWLWERHRALGPNPPPPPALAWAAEGLLLLDGALSSSLLLGFSPELRQGLRSVRRALGCRGKAATEAAVAANEEPRATQVPPDVQHFWQERRDAQAREESDPLPWEYHQSGP